jgi:hypothetical protein
MCAALANWLCFKSRSKSSRYSRTWCSFHLLAEQVAANTVMQCRHATDITSWREHLALLLQHYFITFCDGWQPLAVLLAGCAIQGQRRFLACKGCARTGWLISCTALLQRFSMLHQVCLCVAHTCKRQFSI